MAQKQSLHLSLSKYRLGRGKPMTKLRKLRALDPASIDLTKANLPQRASSPLKRPVTGPSVLRYGSPLDYHGKPTLQYTLQAIAKLLRRNYRQVYDMAERGLLPPPAVVMETRKGSKIRYWVLPQVMSMQRIFTRVYEEVIAKGYRDTFNEAMAKELLKDSEASVARFLGTDKMQSAEQFRKLVGPYGVVWEKER